MKGKKIPEFLVIIICLTILAVGVSRKEGYHQDEILSYEMANAKFNPWIVPMQPQGRLAKFVENEIEGETLRETFGNIKDTVVDVLKNKGNSKLLSYQADVYEEPVWIDGETFLEYITVGDKDAFSYLSVYFNVKDDTHPPLYFFLLHTMSSFLRESTEPLAGCLVNLAAMTGILILLMWLGHFYAQLLGMKGHARGVGVFAALIYGLSAGAMATTLLNRMYGVLTFFCVGLLVIHLKKWTEHSFHTKNKLLIAVTAMGFLTQYFFLFYCLVLAALTIVLLLGQKRTKELFCYIRSMILAAILGVGIFPFSLSQVLSGDRGVEAFGNLSEGLSGFGTRLIVFAKIVASRTLGGGLLLAVVVVIVILLAIAGIGYIKNRKLQNSSDKSEVFLWWMLVVPALGYFLLAARMSPYLVDRYIMPLFPFVVLGGVLLLGWLAWKLEQRIQHTSLTVFLAGLLVLVQVWNLVQYDDVYLYEGYENQKQIAEEYSDYACICIYDGVTYYENIPEFTEYEKTLLLTLEQLENRQETESIASLNRAILLIKRNVDVDQVLNILEKNYGLCQEEWMLRESVHNDVLIRLGIS